MLNSFPFVRSMTRAAMRSLAGSGACLTLLLAMSTAAIGGCQSEWESQAPNNEGDSSDSADVDGGGDGYAVACELSSLATECTPDWYSDEECDPSNNVEACEWDGGDCCEATCTGPECGLSGFECRDPATGGSGVPVAEPLGSPCNAVADPLAARYGVHYALGRPAGETHAMLENSDANHGYNPFRHVPSHLVVHVIHQCAIQ